MICLVQHLCSWVACAGMQDLREAYLEDFGGLGEERDRTGDWFDARLQELATCAFERQEGTE